MLSDLVKLLVGTQVFEVAFDELKGVCSFSHLMDLWVTGVKLAVEDVILDGCIEQQRLLHDIPNLLPKACHIIIVEIDAINQDFSFIDVVKPQENVDDRALAAT